MKTAVIFDMDGVLVDSEPVWVEVEKEIYLHRYGIRLTDEDFRDTAGVRIDKVLTMHHLRYGLPLQEISARVSDIVTEVGNRIQSAPEPMPGVETLLNALRGHGIPLAVASSSPQKQIERVLSALGLTHYFSHLVSAEGLINGKPHPAVFLLAAEALGVEPESCIVIEDAVNGAIAAKAAQMRVIVIPAPEARSDRRFGIADGQIDSLSEAWPLIETLLR
ncbi:2-deoxyglucose-6-phosphatase [Leminorella grimontii]|uniref:2-deoxyglucose-6-phosphatase n=1 Tax=Leminorella grimontii TaxID=82981 RepID=A0AAV5N3H0_9GAMM|nr:hexitol phosphatase HxpB [Leminorella grimontii]KFC97428.1 2-deoxyglucose-6-phosphate hydrolase [Leminorella grimontii ATCC 33999 = DSM 5078]GKX55212.1 2-deoxyglucose-6-phosphatase [Leminorella grimontii]VFS56760.1 Phosphatase YniC [Leminorella grimontii]